MLVVEIYSTFMFMIISKIDPPPPPIIIRPPPPPPPPPPRPNPPTIIYRPVPAPRPPPPPPPQIIIINNNGTDTEIIYLTSTPSDVETRVGNPADAGLVLGLTFGFIIVVVAVVLICVFCTAT